MMKECYTEDDRMVEIPEYIKNMSKEDLCRKLQLMGINPVLSAI